MMVSAIHPSLAGAQAILKPARFQLFVSPLVVLETNRVSCTVQSTIELCISPHAYSAWPKGTANNYIFYSGLQVAGIIGSDGGAWANDTTGAFFFDPKGTTQHGDQVEPISYFADSGDVADWPQAASVAGPLYHSSLTGRPSASEGDAWWLAWDGNPNLLAGRAHPLGILVESRALAWNYPGGNDDILYFAFTFYNITSLDPADYSAAPAALRPTLLQKAQDLHAGVAAGLGVTLPQQGYTITQLHAAISSDPDVGDAGQNYASVNLPFALGYAWEHSFAEFAGWTFDPLIFSTPFFSGTGLTGIKLMGTPEVSPGVEAGLSKFSTTTNGGGDLNDPRSAVELFRYLAADFIGVQSPCNFNPATTRICFIRQTSPFDIRHFQATGPFTLAPGESASLVAAYVFAAPVRTAGSLICPACDIKPGNSSIIAGLADPGVVAGGVNPIDSIAGFLSATDANGDGVLQEQEFVTVPRSLYGKAQLAQAIFDHQFLLPSAPAAPDFFLVPGDGKVTVMWRPSATEQTGDPYFSIARDAQVLNDQGVLVANPLYDPNFRQFDVEGYRIYRARVDNPAVMTQVAQFDYAGTVIPDYAGQVNPVRSCAPELPGVSACGFDPVVPGQPRTVHTDVALAGSIVQVRFGDRIPLPDGSSLLMVTDTAPELSDTGVPFVFVDETVRNNFRYYYAVTAFDLNSWQSGPSGFESPRVLKSVTPVRPASNFANSATLTSVVYGRGIPLTDSILPALDPATGRFSKPFPPTRDWFITLENIVPEVIAGPGASFSVFLDSLVLGDAYGTNGNCFTAVVPVTYYLRIGTPSDTSSLTLPLVQDCFNVSQSFSTIFDAIAADAGVASRYGGTGAFAFPATFSARLAGNYYTSAFGRGCTNGAPGFSYANTPQSGCDYNGARWFDGPSPASNETAAHPNACAAQTFTTSIVTCFSNAGVLTGVVNIYEAKSYSTAVNVWRNVEGALGGAVRGADYNLYWGAGGSVDSVVDVTNNVLVPFGAGLGASWGFLNQSAAQPSGLGLGFDQRTELTLADFGCVEPFRSFDGPQLQIPCASTASGDGPIYGLSSTAVPGPMAFFTGPIADNQTHATAPNYGIALAMPGHLFLMELNGGQLPPAGTVWSLRDYVGAIRGGGVGCGLCLAGADGPYAFSAGRPRPLGVGTEIRFTADVVNQVNAPRRTDLTAVHTVPDPYYLTNDFEADATGQVIKFVNLPADAVIRIYSSSGVLVSLFEHHSTTLGGAADWDVRNRTGRRVSSGVYFYHIEAGNARRVGRFTVVNNRPGF